MREDEVAAASMGVNLVRTKLWAYAHRRGASAASPARSSATYNNTVNVDQFEFGFSVFILAMVIIGGMGNIWGVIVGAVALSMLNRYGLPELNQLPKFGFDFDVDVDQLRHLRLLPADHDGAPARGPHPVRQTKARAARRGRRERPRRGRVGDMSQLYEVRE